jgi:small conductance mechanosensitive channel
MEEFINSFKHQITSVMPKAATGLIICLAFAVAGIITDKIILRLAKARPDKTDMLSLLAQTAKIGLFVVGLITGLGTMGVDVSGLVAGLGLTGFALGFAFRDTLSNLLAGVLILSYEPFKRNDYISVANLEGVVSRIDLRYTTLQAEDKQYLIPNSLLLNNAISLWSHEPKHFAASNAKENETVSLGATEKE